MGTIEFALALLNNYGCRLQEYKQKVLTSLQIEALEYASRNPTFCPLLGLGTKRALLRANVSIVVTRLNAARTTSDNQRCNGPQRLTYE